MKLDQSVEIRPKSPGVSLETRPDIKEVRNNKVARNIYDAYVSRDHFSPC